MMAVLAAWAAALVTLLVGIATIVLHRSDAKRNQTTFDQTAGRLLGAFEARLDDGDARMDRMEITVSRQAVEISAVRDRVSTVEGRLKGKAFAVGATYET